MKRNNWTEADVDDLPAGEHDSFERKSGQLFRDPGELKGALGKVVSAMANSGGGHIILGVADDGTPDGVPPLQGSTPTREWLEQIVPHLVEYPLQDLRCHVVERSTPSRIPPDREVIVIDVGDSALAPHQSAFEGRKARKYTYYCRQGGRSVPAPHFYLELLRQRLVNPVLEPRPQSVLFRQATLVDVGLFVELRLHIVVKNTGRVTAYRWQIFPVGARCEEARGSDFIFNEADYPPGVKPNHGIDITDYALLPGRGFNAHIEFGVLLRGDGDSVQRQPAVADATRNDAVGNDARNGSDRFAEHAVRTELDTLLGTLEVDVQVATEVSPGDRSTVAIAPLANIAQLTAEILKAIQRTQ